MRLYSSHVNFQCSLCRVSVIRTLLAGIPLAPKNTYFQRASFREERRCRTLKEMTLPAVLRLGACPRIENLLRKSPFWPDFPIIFVKLGPLFASNDRNI